MSVDEIHYTLLSDGATDKALMRILTWLLYQRLPGYAVQRRWADLRQLPKPPKALHEKIRAAVRLYPCDLLFVHRDAEGKPLPERKAEIDDAVRHACGADVIPPAVAVIPVRMTETWLLFDAQAIRNAAGNPNGSIKLDLPQSTELECITDPKNVLRKMILQATELGSHRRARFDVGNAIQRIPEYIDDFSPLRKLSAFTALEERITEVLREQPSRE
jgi:hypothetical protein